MANVRVRSPNYPTVSLVEAIGRVKTIYGKEHLHAVPRVSLAKDLGYGGINGASASLLSALTKYGLLAPAGDDQMRVSNDAVDILLHSPGEPERVTALQKAAARPALFNDLQGQYGGTLPSDHALGIYLQKKGFSPNTVGSVIRVYRDTMELVKAESELLDAAPSAEEEQPEVLSNSRTPQPAPIGGPGGQFAPVVGPTVPIAPTAPPQYYTSPDMTVLWFKLAEDCAVRAEFTGTATQEAIRKFMKLLEVSLDTFPKRQAPRQNSLFDEADENP